MTTPSRRLLGLGAARRRASTAPAESSATGEPVLVDVPIADLVVAACMEARHGMPADRTALAAQLAALTDAELRLAWWSSYVRLRRRQQVAGRTASLASVVLERSWYLDEIERRARSDAGFATWVRRGGLPGDEPVAKSEPRLFARSRRRSSRDGGSR